MQFTLIAKDETIVNVNAVLDEAAQTPFFYRVLEMLRHQVRADRGYPVSGARSEAMQEVMAQDPQLQPTPEALGDELNFLAIEMAEELVELQDGGEEDESSEEGKEAVIDALSTDIAGVLGSTVYDFFHNPDNSDQLDVLANLDFTTGKDLTWVTSTNGGFTFVLKDTE